MSKKTSNHRYYLISMYLKLCFLKLNLIWIWIINLNLNYKIEFEFSNKWWKERSLTAWKERSGQERDPKNGHIALARWPRGKKEAVRKETRKNGHIALAIRLHILHVFLYLPLDLPPPRKKKKSGYKISSKPLTLSRLVEKKEER